MHACIRTHAAGFESRQGRQGLPSKQRHLFPVRLSRNPFRVFRGFGKPCADEGNRAAFGLDHIRARKMRTVAGFGHRQRRFFRIDGFDFKMGERIAVNPLVRFRPARALAHLDADAVPVDAYAFQRDASCHGASSVQQGVPSWSVSTMPGVMLTNSGVMEYSLSSPFH